MIEITNYVSINKNDHGKKHCENNNQARTKDKADKQFHTRALNLEYNENAAINLIYFMHINPFFKSRQKNQWHCYAIYICTVTKIKGSVFVN